MQDILERGERERDVNMGQEGPDKMEKGPLVPTKIIGNSFSDISTTLAKDFIASHSFESISSNIEGR